MTSLTSHLSRSLALAAVLAVGICSSVMNWRFGFQLGSSPIDGYVLGVFGVALDAIKWLAPLFAGLAFAQKAYVRSVAAVLVWLACIAWSFTSAVGFSATNREAVTTEHQAVTEELERAQGRLKQAHEDLALIRSNPRWVTSVGCTNATTPPSISLCQKAQQIEKQIQAAEIVLNSVTPSNADAQVDLLARLSGSLADRVRTVLVLLVAIVSELVSSLGFFVIAMSPRSEVTKPETKNRRKKRVTKGNGNASEMATRATPDRARKSSIVVAGRMRRLH